MIPVVRVRVEIEQAEQVQQGVFLIHGPHFASALPDSGASIAVAASPINRIGGKQPELPA
ncbi:hypothetical protein GCM10009753_74980 [Streptantibioticus ferralitis]